MTVAQAKSGQWKLVQDCLIEIGGMDEASAARLVEKARAVLSDSILHLEPLYIARDLSGGRIQETAETERKYDALLQRPSQKEKLENEFTRDMKDMIAKIDTEIVRLKIAQDSPVVSSLKRSISIKADQKLLQRPAVKRRRPALQKHSAV